MNKAIERDRRYAFNAMSIDNADAAADDSRLEKQQRLSLTAFREMVLQVPQFGGHPDLGSHLARTAMPILLSLHRH